MNFFWQFLLYFSEPFSIFLLIFFKRFFLPVLKHVEPFLSLYLSGWILTFPDCFDYFWAFLNRFLTFLNLFIPFWTFLSHFGPILTFQTLFQSFLVLFNVLDPSRTFFKYFPVIFQFFDPPYSRTYLNITKNR